MTTDFLWTDALPEPQAVRDDGGRCRGGSRHRKAMLAVLVSLSALATLAVGLVVLLGASAGAVGGCGGG